MRYSLTFLESEFAALNDALDAVPGVENAAYLVCRISRTNEETRLLVQELIPIKAEDIVEASPAHMKIASRSFRHAMKRADQMRSGFVFVHSHPAGVPNHSSQDDLEEAPLFRTAYNRIHADVIHASLIVSERKVTAARVWLVDGSTQPIEIVRVLGKRFRYWFPGAQQANAIPEFFDRQVQAFGSDIQRVLNRLHAGIVGAGGTGSILREQLTRLGVGRVTVADGDNFTASNVNRLYGSRAIDGGIPKTKIAERAITDVGLGTKVTLIPKSITYLSAFQALKNCDIVFGCTDDNWGRSLLSRLAIYYLIPVFDMGVKIDSTDGKIRSINGRVTTLMSGSPCLFCRGRITPERVYAESVCQTDPQRADELRKEGYLPELGEAAPAVITFTTTIAATAVNEFLQKLTGFMGEVEGSEVIHLFDRGTARRNSKPSQEGCFCSEPSFFGRGDVQPLLDCTWRSE
jgi:molybdopterin/thiamine biosynthesis adenylyltransferase